MDALYSARSYIESAEDPLDRLRTMHLALEYCSEPPQWLEEAHASFDLEKLRPAIASHRRAASHWWYWRGVLTTEDWLSSGKESIVRLRNSECGQAAKQLMQRLANEL